MLQNHNNVQKKKKRGGKYNLKVFKIQKDSSSPLLQQGDAAATPASGSWATSLPRCQTGSSPTVASIQGRVMHYPLKVSMGETTHKQLWEVTSHSGGIVSSMSLYTCKVCVKEQPASSLLY